MEKLWGGRGDGFLFGMEVVGMLRKPGGKDTAAGLAVPDHGGSGLEQR